MVTDKLCAGITNKLIILAKDTDPLEGRNKTQDDLDLLGKWTYGNQLKFNGEKIMSVDGALFLKPTDLGFTSPDLYPLTHGRHWILESVWGLEHGFATCWMSDMQSHYLS